MIVDIFALGLVSDLCSHFLRPSAHAQLVLLSITNVSKGLETIVTCNDMSESLERFSMHSYLCNLQNTLGSSPHQKSIGSQLYSEITASILLEQEVNNLLKLMHKQF